MNGRSHLTIAIAVTVSTLAADAMGRQDFRASGSIRLTVPEAIDMADVSILYLLTGPFGAYGSFVRTRPTVREYDIDASQAGRPADKLRAIIYCPGYRTVLLTESRFDNGPPRVVPIELEPLGWIRLAGRVTDAVAAPQPLAIEVTYLAVWSHPFFGIADGAVASYVVASTELKPDGSFETMVPDLAHDPAVARYAGNERGFLQLLARDPQTGNIAYFLKARESPSQIGLPIATVYPGELQFMRLAQ